MALQTAATELGSLRSPSFGSAAAFNESSAVEVLSSCDWCESFSRPVRCQLPPVPANASVPEGAATGRSCSGNFGVDTSAPQPNAAAIGTTSSTSSSSHLPVVVDEESALRECDGVCRQYDFVERQEKATPQPEEKERLPSQAGRDTSHPSSPPAAARTKTIPRSPSLQKDWRRSSSHMQSKSPRRFHRKKAVSPAARLRAPSSQKRSGSGVGDWCQWARHKFGSVGALTSALSLYTGRSSASSTPKSQRAAVTKPNFRPSQRQQLARVSRQVPEGASKVATNELLRKSNGDRSSQPLRQTRTVSLAQQSSNIDTKSIKAVSVGEKPKCPLLYSDVLLRSYARCLLQMTLCMWMKHCEISALERSLEGHRETAAETNDDRSDSTASEDDDRSDSNESDNAQTKSCQDRSLDSDLCAQALANEPCPSVAALRSLSMLACIVNAWARVAERCQLQRQFESEMQKLEQQQESVFSEAIAQRESEIRWWATKTAHAMMSSRLQEALIMIFSSWMRVAKHQRHHKDLEKINVAHRHEIDAKTAELQNERSQLWQSEMDCSRLQCEIECCEQKLIEAQANLSLAYAASQNGANGLTPHSAEDTGCYERQCSIPASDEKKLELLHHSLQMLDERRRYDLMMLVPGMQRIARSMSKMSGRPPKCKSRTSSSSSLQCRPPVSPGRCTSAGSVGQCESLTESSDSSIHGSPIAATLTTCCDAENNNEAVAHQSLLEASSTLAGHNSQPPCPAELETRHAIHHAKPPLSQPTQHVRACVQRRWSQEGRRQAPRATAAEGRRRKVRRRSVPASTRRPVPAGSIAWAPEEEAFSFDVGCGSN